MSTKVKGNLMIIGGNEDKENNCIILKKFIELSNRGKVIIMTTATEKPEQVGKKYLDIFTRLGCESVEVLDIPDRVYANNHGNIEKLDKAAGIFFTGGDQLKITGTLGGTIVDRKLHELYERGVVIAGTSAGASVMSSTMIVGGSNDETPRKDALNMAPGMALIEEVVIDQHFAQRGRIGRLLTVVAQNPHNLGIGIDEDTAIIINNSQCFRVIGSQTVTVVDGETISFTNVSETGERYPLGLADVKLHVLPPGLGFDLKTRRPILSNSVEE
ncbi:MAG TPA: cyanophycinase [Candidatus Deferrimicrobium sp.]|nr:cyanophycinase [Candidatus Deferrimicrobium sp.]